MNGLKSKGRRKLWTERRMEKRTPISHLAKAGVPKILCYYTLLLLLYDVTRLVQSRTNTRGDEKYTDFCLGSKANAVIIINLILQKNSRF